MALSAQDKAFYEEKLTIKSFAYLYTATVLIGVTACPLLMYVQDHMDGLDARWNGAYFFHTVAVGFVLGTVVSAALYVALVVLLQLGWLPSRRG
jgi:hypothetical protein